MRRILICLAFLAVTSSVQSQSPIRQKGDTTIVNTRIIGKKIVGYNGKTPVDIYIVDGLISKIIPEENYETEDYFIDAERVLPLFVGKTPEKALEIEVDAVSGATYSSNALIENVRIGLRYLKDN